MTRYSCIRFRACALVTRAEGFIALVARVWRVCSEADRGVTYVGYRALKAESRRVVRWWYVASGMKATHLPPPGRSTVVVTSSFSVSLIFSWMIRSNGLGCCEAAPPVAATWCAECSTCLTSKRKNLVKTALAPHRIPCAPWEVVFMDEVSGFPPSDGFDAIWVFMDQLSKMVHFVAVTKSGLDSVVLAKLYTQHV